MEVVEKIEKITSWFALRYINKIPYEDIKEFKSFAALAYLEGRSLETSYDFIAADFLRKFRYRTGTRGSSDALAVSNRVPAHPCQDYNNDNINYVEPQTKESQRPDRLCELSSQRGLEPYLRRIRWLPKEYRMILMLSYEHELSNIEISRVMGVSESRVSQMHIKALQLLQKSLQESLPPEKQSRAKQESKEALSFYLQNGPEFYRKEEGLLENLCFQETSFLESSEEQEISQDLEESFGINSF